KYVVTIIEDGTTVRASYDQPANVTNLPTLWLTPGHSYVARVTPQNNADTDNWNTTSSGSIVAIGAPQPAGGLVATQISDLLRQGWNVFLLRRHLPLGLPIRRDQCGLGYLLE
ncbi:MAG: hypothetical protein RR609_07255, partial [Aurantimicrobium sp.]